MKRAGKVPPLILIGAALLLTGRATALEPPLGNSLGTPGAELYVFGWSHDGKFAYALVDQPPYRGGYGFSCEIVDARTDQVLWSHYDHSDRFGWDGSDAPLAPAWERNLSMLKEQLGAFGVEPAATARIEPLPLQRGTDEFTAVVNEWRVNPDTSPYGNGVVGYTLTLRSRERGSKVIAQRAHLFTTDIEVVGYVRSPFENRIVLVVAESGNAYGGERFTDFTVIGAHLEAGFE